MSRRPSIRDLELKLKAALLELKASKEMCDCLISERDDHETEIRSVIFMNTKLKGELAEMDVKCNDLTDQRDRLQVLVSEMDDCRNHYEQSLLQFKCFKRRNYQLQFGFVNHQVASSFSRERSIRGGSLILIRNNLKFKERKDIVSLSVERVIEIACVELERLVVMSVYRPPHSSYELFESVMDQALCKINDKSKRIAICGDFNVDLLDASNRGVRNKELEFVNSTVFLGITLDDRLQWGPHIKYLEDKINGHKRLDLLPGCVIPNLFRICFGLYVQIRKELPLSFLLVLLEGKLPPNEQ
ncbi:hypothetical protein EVAR_18578_1 [Eumeta japonica]|uniref:Endonuclease/exonuclease/phosphatase domain-containing protein n=1 Tax=Eumeta variegata TaxID=151549 RepID=A0A4C1V2Q0_EUMVA|nr:hypothetical protein EVAR_18578_1 [Eumeta japonica]